VALDRESYWLDELASLDVIGESWRGLARVLAQFDNHPPLYFVLLKAWCSVFGRSETATRAMSALFGVATIPVAWAIGRRVGSSRSAALAAALVASAPFLVRYAREARGYSLLALLTLATMATWLRMLARPQWRNVGWFALALAATLYTHVYGLLTAAGLLAAIVWLHIARATDARASRRALVGLVVAGALFSPWIPVVMARTRRVGADFWLPPAPWNWALEWGARGWTASIYVTLVAALAAVGLSRSRVADGAVARNLESSESTGAGESGGFSRTSIAMVIALVPLPLLLAIPFRPMFMAKYAIGALAVLLVSAAIGAARWRAGRLVSCALAVLGTVLCIVRVIVPRENEQWREAAHFAREQHSRARAPIAIAHHAPRWRHYVNDADPIELRADGTLAHDGTNVADWLRRRHARDVWLLEAHPPATDPQLHAALTRDLDRVELRSWLGARAIRWHLRITPAP